MANRFPNTLILAQPFSKVRVCAKCPNVNRRRLASLAPVPSETYGRAWKRFDIDDRFYRFEEMYASAGFQNIIVLADDSEDFGMAQDYRWDTYSRAAAKADQTNVSADRATAEDLRRRHEYAKRLVEHLERSGFVVMKRPAIGGNAPAYRREGPLAR